MINKTTRKWLSLLAMSLSLAMVFLDQSALPVALPQIQRHLNASDIMLQWVVNGYMLTIAAVIIFGGRVGDHVGHRKTFLCGVVVFVTASLLCALSPSIIFLIAARALQGIGGAFMIPIISVLVFNSVEVHERGKIMGIFVGSAAIFIVLGPLLGGTLTQFLSWRWIFGLNLPIAAVVISLTLWLIPSREQSSTDETLDWRGFILSSLALVSLIFALMESVDIGWLSSWVIGSLVIFIMATIAFYHSQKTTTYPLIDFDLFKLNNFRSAVLCLLTIQIVFIATIYWPIFHQDILGFSPGMAGLMALPGVIPVVFAPTIGGWLFDRYGPRLPVTLGALGIAIAMMWIGLLAFWHNYWLLAPGYFLFGLSAPLTVASNMATAVTSVPENKRGLASGLASGARQLGGALGITIAATLITSIDKWQVQRFLQQAPPVIQNIDYKQITGLLAHSTAAKQAIEHLNPLQFASVKQAAIDSYTLAFSSGMLTMSLIALCGFYLARKLPNQPLKV